MAIDNWYQLAPASSSRWLIGCGTLSQGLTQAVLHPCYLSNRLGMCLPQGLCSVWSVLSLDIYMT
jgi:hypothetical protein